MTPTLNIRWQSEQQHAGPQHAFPQSDPSPYHQLPFSASYHATPFPPHSIPQLTSDPQIETNHDWHHNRLFPLQPSTDGFNHLAGPGTAFNPLADPAENLRASLPFDLQVMNPQLSSNSYPLPGAQTPLSAYPPNSHVFPLAQPYPLQYQERSAPLSHHYDIPPHLTDGMWSNTAAFIGTYVC